MEDGQNVDEGTVPAVYVVGMREQGQRKAGTIDR